MRRLWGSALLLSFLLTPSLSTAEPLKAFVENQRGLTHLKQKQAAPAYQNFLKALSQDPLNPLLHMNLGLTFMAEKQWKNAAQSFQTVLTLSKNNPELQYEAAFNLAVAQAQQGQIDEALKAYQQALTIHPDSLQVKTNIELLWKGQGGGKGKAKSKNKNGDDKKKDQGGQGNNNSNPNKPQNQPPQNQPQQFKSKDLTKEDVKTILREIENQEQSIRSKVYQGKVKERSHGQDW